MNITYRPIDVWPGEQTRERKPSPFRGRMGRETPYPDTLRLLESELWHLGAKNVVFQIAVREQDIRQDGAPRANAKATHPGVILAFDSVYGPLKYATDTFTTFQANVRAIALGLEALRKVDRYGITKRGEQYTGWKALPASTQPALSTEAAARFLATHSGGNYDPEDILAERDWLVDAYRMAAKKLHPDAGGATEDFQLLQEARRVLNAHHGGTK